MHKCQNRKDGVKRQRQGLLDFSVSFCMCLWKAFHLYNKSSLGRTVSWYEKGTKNEMMSDSQGKNRSYVKINLSVLQQLLYKPEQKGKKKNLVRRCFFPLKLSFIAISVVLWGTTKVLQYKGSDAVQPAHVLPDGTLARGPHCPQEALTLYPNSDTNLLSFPWQVSYPR